MAEKTSEEFLADPVAVMRQAELEGRVVIVGEDGEPHVIISVPQDDRPTVEELETENRRLREALAEWGQWMADGYDPEEMRTSAVKAAAHCFLDAQEDGEDGGESHE